MESDSTNCSGIFGFNLGPWKRPRRSKGPWSRVGSECGSCYPGASQRGFWPMGFKTLIMLWQNLVSRMFTKYYACHQKWAWCCQRSTPAIKNEPLGLCFSHVHEMPPTPASKKEPHDAKTPRLPSKMSCQGRWIQTCFPSSFPFQSLIWTRFLSSPKWTQAAPCKGGYFLKYIHMYIYIYFFIFIPPFPCRI